MSPPLNTKSGAPESLKDAANLISEFIAFSLAFTVKAFEYVGAKKLTFEFITFKSRAVSLFVLYVTPFMPSIASPGVVSKVMFSYILLESITDAGSL